MHCMHVDPYQILHEIVHRRISCNVLLVNVGNRLIYLFIFKRSWWIEIVRWCPSAMVEAATIKLGELDN